MTILLEIKPLSFKLGAEIKGVNISSISECEFSEIHRAFLDYGGLLLFREQRITREEHIDFSRRFGELDKHDAVPLDRHPVHPELLMVVSTPVVEGMTSTTKYLGQAWHSDMSMTLRPAKASLLRSIEVPPAGGDTMFANMYEAYDSLSAGLKDVLDKLEAIHVRERKGAGAEWDAMNRKLNPPVAQPVVRVHPETGRKALYIGRTAKSFKGLTEDESAPLINYLIEHATQHSFTYRHRWQENDVLLWDNRSTIHLALGDYDPRFKRHMERTTILGEFSGNYLN